MGAIYCFLVQHYCEVKGPGFVEVCSGQNGSTCYQKQMGHNMHFWTLKALSNVDCWWCNSKQLENCFLRSMRLTFFPLSSHSYYVYLWTVKGWNQCNRLRLIPFPVVWSVENYCKEHQKSEDWNAIFYLGYQGCGPMVDEREFSHNYSFFLTVEGDSGKVADSAVSELLISQMPFTS